MAGHGEWNESLFGCFDNLGVCLCGWCCTPCLFGQNVEKIDESNYFVWCCGYMCLGGCYLCWIPHYLKRKQLRENYGLREEPECGDLPTTICCSPCALCQEARFLNRRAGQPHASTGVVPQTAQPGRHY